MIAKYPLMTGRWPAGRLDQAIAGLNIAALAVEYRSLREAAPQRSARGKKYFVGHTGSTPSGSSSNRREEHLARALCADGIPLPWPSGGVVRLLDYQVPLKARQNDAGIGKIDLMGVTTGGQLVVVELKVDGANGGRSDPPLAAFMEALRYAAIVEANRVTIADEAKTAFHVTASDKLPPAILLLGTNAWWHSWLEARSAGPWTAVFVRLLNDIESELGIPARCLAIAESDLDRSVGRKFSPVAFA